MPVAAPPRSFRLDRRPHREPLLRFPVGRLASPVALRAFAGAAAALMVVVFTADAVRPLPAPTGNLAAPAFAPAPAGGGLAGADQLRREATTGEVRDAASRSAPLAARSAPQAGGAPAAPGERSELAAPAPEAPAAAAVDVTAGDRQVVSRESGQTGAGWPTPGRLGALALAVVAAGLLFASFLIKRKPGRQAL